MSLWYCASRFGRCTAMTLCLVAFDQAEGQAPRSMFGQRGPMNSGGLSGGLGGGRFGGNLRGLDRSSQTGAAAGLGGGGLAGGIAPVPPAAPGAVPGTPFLGGGVAERFIGAPPPARDGAGGVQQQAGDAAPLPGRGRSAGATSRRDATDGANARLDPPVQPLVRVQRRIGFEYKPPRTDLLQNQLRDRLKGLRDRSQSFRNLDLTVLDEGLVVLRGVADSARAKRIAAYVVKMEPGVRAVRNEIVVTE